jgi:hypothetical protein
MLSSDVVQTFEIGYLVDSNYCRTEVPQYYKQELYHSHYDVHNNNTIIMTSQRIKINVDFLSGDDVAVKSIINSIFIIVIDFFLTVHWFDGLTCWM